MRYLRSKKIKSSKIRAPKQEIIILVDDRERNPWHIDHPDFTFETARLKIGDYTIKGYEDQIAIEKKSGIVELISNLSGKDRPRFKKFLNKLSKVPIKCIIIEDSFAYIDTAFRSCPKTHLTPTSIYFWLNEIMFKYKIPVLFMGKNNSRRRDEFLYYLFTSALNQAKINTI